MLLDGFKNNVAKSMEVMAIKSGEIAMETSCGFLLYEPTIPEELLKLNKN
ncbi:cyclic lactone autoinducer peptide [Paenibacillus sp. FSL R5-0341]|nr:cyclic lactone autoinducer peptide [Paenibacillus amylolyticus]